MVGRVGLSVRVVGRDERLWEAHGRARFCFESFIIISHNKVSACDYSFPAGGVKPFPKESER